MIWSPAAAEPLSTPSAPSLPPPLLATPSAYLDRSGMVAMAYRANTPRNLNSGNASGAEGGAGGQSGYGQLVSYVVVEPMLTDAVHPTPPNTHSVRLKPLPADSCVRYAHEDEYSHGSPVPSVFGSPNVSMTWN
eukprot:1384281-Prymnesium_polylepis.1